jgi:hypothetical protein
MQDNTRERNDDDKRNVINLQVKTSINQRLFSPHYGFSFDPKHNNSELACLVIGEKNVAVNFFSEPERLRCDPASWHVPIPSGPSRKFQPTSPRHTRALTPSALVTGIRYYSTKASKSLEERLKAAGEGPLALGQSTRHE